ncbi:hypothetical protein ACNPL9_13695, partial [Enterococcus faecium]
TVTLIPNGIHHPPIEDGRLLPNSVKKLHQELLDQRNKEQKKAFIQRSMDFLAPLCCLVLTLFAFWLVWGG